MKSGRGVSSKFKNHFFPPVFPENDPIGDSFGTLLVMKFLNHKSHKLPFTILSAKGRLSPEHNGKCQVGEIFC